MQLLFWPYGQLPRDRLNFFAVKLQRLYPFSALLLLSITVLFFMTLSDISYLVPHYIFGGTLLVYAGIVSMRVVYIQSVIRHILGACFVLWGSSSLFSLLGYIYILFIKWSFTTDSEINWHIRQVDICALTRIPWGRGDRD